MMEERKKGLFFKEYILPVLFFFSIALFLLWRSFLGKVYIGITGDDYFVIYPWLVYFRQMTQIGIFPLWIPYILCGHPFGTEAMSSINIANLLSFFMDTGNAWNIWRMLHFALAGIFTWQYAKLIGFNKAASILAGFIFMLTPLIFRSYVYSSNFFMPLILFCIEKQYAKSGYRWILFSSLFSALLFYNTNPQYTVYFYIFFVFYIIARGLATKENNKLRKVIIILTLFLTFTIGLAFFQIVRLGEIAPISQRALHASYKHETLFPTHWVTAIFPFLYESPFVPHIFFFGRIEGELVKNIHFLGNPVAAPYIGILPLMLALSLITIKTKDFYKKFFVWTMFIIIFYVTFDKPMSLLYRHIPVVGKNLDLMTFPSRSYIIYYFALSLLSAMTFSLLLDKNAEMIKKITLTSKIFLRIAIIIGLILTVLHLALIFYKSHFLSYAQKMIVSYISSHKTYIAGLNFYFERINQFYEFIKAWSNILNPSFWVSSCIILLIFILINYYKRNKLSSKYFMLLSFILIGIDLMFFNYKELVYTEKSLLKPRVPVIDFIKSKTGIFRVAPLLDILTPETELQPNSILRPGTNILYGISSPEGLQSLLVSRNVEMMKRYALKTKNMFIGLVGEIEIINDRFADMMNIKYIVTSANRQLKDNYKKIYQDGDYAVYENLDLLPRAYAVFNYEVLTNKNAILDRLAEQDFSYDKSVILESNPILQRSTKYHTIKPNVIIDNYSPHRIDITADLPAEGLVVLLDSFYPGWKVYVDERLSRILVANYCFRAVEVPVGKHKVTFLYDSELAKIGIFISLFMLASLVLWIVFERR